ncbi:MAG: glutamyl-tRNA reductase [Gemmatimonadetes bacterium]|nr:glutamyl-tRNA reductase [Gemmatimonadota bacterium]
MALMVVGLSHRTAPVEVRERLAFPGGEAEQALALLRSEGVGEAVLLATCNRTELYLNPESEGVLERVENFLAKAAGPLPGSLGRYLYRHSGDEVALHLFRVTSGLDSMVLGEAEVQGQVRDAYQRSAGAEPPLTAAVLNRLFQTALSVGGRVRSETTVGEGAASVASVAVDLARKIFGELRGKRILLLGAGDTAELVVAALGRHGVHGVVVANRTFEPAVELAAKLKGQAIRLDEIQRALADADIVITSTAAPHPLITRRTVAEAHPGGLGRPLLMVDIAIPRDVEPEVGGLPNVFLYNVDHLQKILDEILDLRRVAAVAAEELVAREASAFGSWHRSLAAVPAIRALREHFERVRAAELERMLERMPQLSPDDRAAFEGFTRRLINQLLHEPTTRLREAAEEGRGEEVLAAVRFLTEGEGEP